MAAVFDFLDGAYKHTYKGKATLKNGEADCIELTSNSGDYDKLTVYIDVKTGLPVRVSYHMDNLNTDAIVDIQNISTATSTDKTRFDFDAKRYKDFEIIDFR